MKMGGGWTGRILRIDLTNRRWSVEPTERFAERFIGGIGIGLKICWDEVGPEVGALDPENRLVFAPGPLAGTLAPASGRIEVVSKSPRSYPKETVTRSGMGGYWGPELKFAGYDALIIQGKADRWINLWIYNDHVEFRDAKEYLGRDTYSTQIGLRKELDPQAKILCIGPAGENLSRLAVILSETSFASGRSGFGAVMGSKNLKAIAVRGTKPLKIFGPERLIEVSKTVRRLAAGNPMREWTTRNLNEREREAFLNKYRKKNTGCFGCPLQCFAHVSIPDAGQSAVHCSNYYYYPKATQYYGEGLERDQAVSDGYVLANRLGLDTYEHRRMIEFLEDLYKAGLLKASPELPMDQLGSRKFIQKLLEDIAMRRGIGDLLSEGCARAADQIKGGWEYASRYFPAHGSATHGTEQMVKYPVLALMWTLDSRDPFIDHHAYLKLAVTDQTRPEPYRLSQEHAKTISKKILGSERAVDHSTFEYKPEAAIYVQNRSAIVNLLVVCDWIYPVLSSLSTEDRMGDTSVESQLLTAVTGEKFSEEELNRIGERVWNLSRAIMVREGRTRENDTLHESYFSEQPDPRTITISDFEQAKTRYYHLRGWDENTGWPTKEKLAELGLQDIAEGLLDRI
jgi:aldehyde:ferredoxin oxidoreductase